jgi:hypothetical protein
MKIELSDSDKHFYDATIPSGYKNAIENIKNYSNHTPDFLLQQLHFLKLDLTSSHRWSGEMNNALAMIRMMQTALPIAIYNQKPKILRDLEEEVESWLENVIPNKTHSLADNLQQ